MKVQEVKLDNNQRRYLLVDDIGLPLIPVAKYLKYIDNSVANESGITKNSI